MYFKARTSLSSFAQAAISKLPVRSGAPSQSLHFGACRRFRMRFTFSVSDRSSSSAASGEALSVSPSKNTRSLSLIILKLPVPPVRIIPTSASMSSCLAAPRCRSAAAQASCAAR